LGFAARLAGHWSNGHFIAVVLHLGWTNIAGLLFVNLYFYIFNQQRFRDATDNPKRINSIKNEE